MTVLQFQEATTIEGIVVKSLNLNYAIEVSPHNIGAYSRNIRVVIRKDRLSIFMLNQYLKDTVELINISQILNNPEQNIRRNEDIFKWYNCEEYIKIEIKNRDIKSLDGNIILYFNDAEILSISAEPSEVLTQSDKDTNEYSEVLTQPAKDINEYSVLTKEEIDALLEVVEDKVDTGKQVADVLSERGNEYKVPFKDNATALGKIVKILAEYPNVSDEALGAAVYMQLKILRFLGNPNHEDTKLDLVGYSTLIKENL